MTFSAKSLVLVAMLAFALTEASSLKLDKVVRALDALYKKQAGEEGGATTPTDHSGEGSGSGYFSGERKGGMCGMRSSLREIKDYMFIQNVRSSTGAFNGVCMDIFHWLNEHGEEEEMAHESEGLDSIPDPASEEKGPTIVDAEVSGKASAKGKGPKKMEDVKKQLRALKRQMEGKEGDFEGDEGYEEYGSGDEDINDGDIKWHRLFLSCYVWMHLSDGAAYNMVWKK